MSRSASAFLDREDAARPVLLQLAFPVGPLSGLASLHRAQVTELQLRQLSEVMIRALDLTITELPL
ncbi:hypothetical protein [Nocardiopsis alba]|uniref:hypothetical protein n=1 Tax=Nocardiopsis alba TaxID=53437 RepID=UPI0033B24B18